MTKLLGAYKAQIAKKEDRDMCTVYTVKVIGEDGSHCVQRRYTDFANFRESFGWTYPGVPEMPPKSIFRKACSSRFNERRDLALRKLLEAAVEVDPFASHAALQQLLGVKRQDSSFFKDLSGMTMSSHAGATLATLEKTGHIASSSKILLVTSSVLGNSACSRAANGFIEAIQDNVSGVQVATVDLTKMATDGTMPPYTATDSLSTHSPLGEALVIAVREDSATQHECSNRLTEQFLDADVYVFAVPMCNLDLPSHLKHWMSHVLQPQKTFDPVTGCGILKSKVGFVVSSSCSGLLGSPVDRVTPTLQKFFGQCLEDPQHVYYTNINGMPNASDLIARAVDDMKSQARL